MISLSFRLALAAFVALTGALATNMFVLQPPGRGLQTASLRSEQRRDGVASWLGHLTTSRAEATGSVARDVPPVVPAVGAGAGGDDAELTRAIQRELKSKGYETGTVDGMAGLVTRAAIMAYEADSGLRLTGEPQQGLLQHLVLGSAGADAVGDARPDSHPGAQAEALIRFVQRALTQLGYAAGALDGAMSTETSAAIRKFEAAQRLRVSGRISGELVAKLMALTGQSGVADAR